MSIGGAIAFGVERIVEPVQGMHAVIAARWFDVLGPIGRPVRSSYTAISRLVYGSIRLSATAVGAGLDAVLRAEPSTADTADAWVTGLWGDGPHTTGRGMSVRDLNGAPVAVATDLAAAFPDATGRLVVLAHGLVMTERCWLGTDTEQGLARALAGHPDVTPVLIRYDTGLPVAENGARLAALLEELHARWPVPVSSIALVGHSMGGLVVAHACVVGRESGQHWVDDLTDVVTIGAPLRGAPLEKLVAATAWGLGVARTTRPLAEFLNRRSLGIKDLRTGFVTTRPIDLHAAGQPAAVRHHLVAGVVTSDPCHPFGAIVGDLMVRPASSTKPSGFRPSNTLALGGVHHFDLPSDPAVLDHVIGWLTTPRP